MTINDPKRSSFCGTRIHGSHLNVLLANEEFRTLFRLNTELSTHLSSSETQTAPLPSNEALDKEKYSARYDIAVEQYT